MARPREFDTTVALDQAMQVFWSKGYEATSLSDLTAAMGLSKSSLYETFGCKHDLFMSSIEHYKRTVSAQVVAAAEIDAPARRVIASLFDRAIERILSDEGRRGCFLNNCASEVAIHDDVAGRAVRDGLGLIEAAFFKLVKRGQVEGHINEERDARATARFLTAAINGMLLIGKANPERETLRDIADTALLPLN